MAGSIHHVIDDNRYIGTRFVENMGDAIETIDELVFVLLLTTTEMQRNDAITKYYRCFNGRELWPVWWCPDMYGETE